MKNFCFLNLNIPLFKDEKSIDDIPKSMIYTLNHYEFLNKELLNFFDSLNLKISPIIVCDNTIPVPIAPIILNALVSL